MAYRFDEYGNIHRLGVVISHAGETLPQRDDVFSGGFAFLGLITGGASGFLISVMIKLITAVFSPDIEFDYSNAESVFNQVITREFIFTLPVIIATAASAAAGFFWDGFEATGENFLVAFGLLGIIMGWLIGLLFGVLVLAVADFVLGPEGAEILAVATFICAVLGFIWNGLNILRKVFSVHRSIVGLICGVIKGILKFLSVLFSGGCFLLIAALIFSPVTAAVFAGFIIYNTLKGFIILGRGGRWEYI